MERAEREKLRVREKKLRISREFSTSQPSRATSDLGLVFTLWEARIHGERAGILGCICFRRELCCPGRAKVRQWPRTQVDLKLWSTRRKFLCLFVQRLGDTEGQVWCKLLLHSWETWQFIFTELCFPLLSQHPNSTLLSSKATLWLIAHLPLSLPFHSPLGSFPFSIWWFVALSSLSTFTVLS